MLTILSVRLLFGCTLACQVVGFGIMIAGVILLLDPTTLNYYGRVLAFNRMAIPGMEITYAIPVAYGSLQAIPMLLIICLLCMKKHHRALLTAFIVVQIIFLCVEFPTTLAPLIMLNGTTRANFSTALADSMNTKFVGLPQSSTESRAYSLMWDKLMVNQKCCGMNGIKDFNTNFNTYASLWYGYYRKYILLNTTQYVGSEVKIPLSCCKLSESSTIVQENKYEDIQAALLTEVCPITQIASHSNNGCFPILYEALSTYTLVMCILLLLVQIVQAVSIGAAFSSMKELNSVGSDMPRATGNNRSTLKLNDHDYNANRYAPSPISYPKPQQNANYANSIDYYRPQPSQGRFGY